MEDSNSGSKAFSHIFLRSRKVGLLKRRARRKVLSRGIKNCTPLWRKAHFEVKMYKTPHAQSTFWSSDVEKLHATVAKSAFWSQNAQNTSWSDHFLKFRCRKIARRCGKKHIFQVKMYKTPHGWTTFWSSDVEKLHAVVARSTFWSENVQNTSAADSFLKFWCRKNARRCGEKRMWKWKCTKHLMVGALFEVQMSKNCTPLWREAHVEVKMHKALTVWEHFLKFRCLEIIQLASSSANQLVN